MQSDVQWEEPEPEPEPRPERELAANRSRSWLAAPLASAISDRKLLLHGGCGRPRTYPAGADRAVTRAGQLRQGLRPAAHIPCRGGQGRYPGWELRQGLRPARHIPCGDGQDRYPGWPGSDRVLRPTRARGGGGRRVKKVKVQLHKSIRKTT